MREGWCKECGILYHTTTIHEDWCSRSSLTLPIVWVWCVGCEQREDRCCCPGGPSL